MPAPPVPSADDEARARRFAAAAPVSSVAESALSKPLPPSKPVAANKPVSKAASKPVTTSKPPPAKACAAVAPPPPEESDESEGSEDEEVKRPPPKARPLPAAKPARQPPARQPPARQPTAAPPLAPTPSAAIPPAPPAPAGPARRKLLNMRAIKSQLDDELADPALLPTKPAPPAPAAGGTKAARKYTVGARVLARSPDDDDDELGGWVTGRVLGTQVSPGGTAQYKVSLDGYDSENDEWMEGDDERLQPYNEASDAKEAAKRTAAEHERARLQSEARRHESRTAHEEAVGIS